ncbi:MAG: undecaprenyl-diphosphate phosphatase [Planctomycetota bacterium]|nr:MAG: undecaprenyl-diphosphate phosphatase [Planctomycetota bacterium]
MDKQLLTAFLLGVVQGVAEFLPISSSGHLVLGETLLRRWTGISAGNPSATGGLFFNVALHLATLLAILVVYRAELRELPRRRRLVGMIVLASVPAAVVGLTLKDWFETAFQTPEVAGIGLLVTSVLLVAGQRWETRRDGLQDLTWQQALLVGMFQAAALVPGISRSGSTIAAGLLAGLRREAATTFSFLIAIPAIGGAALLESLDHVRQGGAGAAGGRPDWQALGIGMAAAFLFGLLSLRWLIGLVNRGRLARFACYTAAVGALTLVLCGVS